MEAASRPAPPQDVGHPPSTSLRVNERESQSPPGPLRTCPHIFIPLPLLDLCRRPPPVHSSNFRCLPSGRPQSAAPPAPLRSSRCPFVRLVVLLMTLSPRGRSPFARTRSASVSAAHAAPPPLPLWSHFTGWESLDSMRSHQQPPRGPAGGRLPCGLARPAPLRGPNGALSGAFLTMARHRSIMPLHCPHACSRLRTLRRSPSHHGRPNAGGDRRLRRPHPNRRVSGSRDLWGRCLVSGPRWGGRPSGRPRLGGPPFPTSARARLSATRRASTRQKAPQ